jgi:hypothetical protein
MLPQPIHAKDYIYPLEIYDDELTIMVYFMIAMGRLYFATNFDAMKECNALESNKIVAG